MPTIQDTCRKHGFNPWVKKMPWRRKWQPTPIFLPVKSHGEKSLVGYRPKGSKESDMTEDAQRHKSLIIRDIDYSNQNHNESSYQRYFSQN